LRNFVGVLESRGDELAVDRGLPVKATLTTSMFKLNPSYYNEVIGKY